MLNLQAVYGGKVTLKNLAVGGTDTAWGLANIGQVIEAKPDLVHLGFWHERCRWATGGRTTRPTSGA